MDYGVHYYSQSHEVPAYGLGRVVGENRMSFEVYCDGESVEVAKQKKLDCCVGDFVQLDVLSKRIEAVLPREGIIHKARNTTSKTFHQRTLEKVMASHVSDIFITIACDQRFTLGKLERYLLVFLQQKVRLHLLLTKSDHAAAAATIEREIQKVYPSVAVMRVSVYEEETLERLSQLIQPEATVILLGASGSGKSTLLNHLTDSYQQTGDVQSNGKGKHTTTETRLVSSSRLQAYFIDTPGFKGIDTTSDYQGKPLFRPIEELALECRFSDCHHQSEPGCAVLRAIEEGDLDEQLLTRYRKYRSKLVRKRK